jgi:histone-lysine N-methyltransferase SUV39H
MSLRASQTSLRPAKYAVRQEFKLRLAVFSHTTGYKVHLAKDIEDQSTPSLRFTFLEDYKYAPGISLPNMDLLVGCTCRPNMAHNCGCEYSQACECLEFAPVSESRLRGDQITKYKEFREGIRFDTIGLPKRFPYRSNGLLQKSVMESGYPIYECNDRCNCCQGADASRFHCRTKVTQRGRLIELEIFKTSNRGWGT